MTSQYLVNNEGLSASLTWTIVGAAAWAFVAWFIVTWQKTSARFDRDIPNLLEDPVRAATTCDLHGHIWARYSNYRLCLRCPTKEYLP